MAELKKKTVQKKPVVKKSPAAKVDATKPVDVESTIEILYSEDDIKKMDSDYKEFHAWLTNKPYGIDNSKGVVKSTLKLLQKRAKWTAQTAMGLNRIYNELKDLADRKDVFLSSMQLHALWYFVSKTEGVGLETAKDAVMVQEYIGNVYQVYEFDYSRLEYLSEKLKAGTQQVPLSLEDVPENVIKYDEHSPWRKEWEMVQKIVADRKAEEEKNAPDSDGVPQDEGTELVEVKK